MTRFPVVLLGSLILIPALVCGCKRTESEAAPRPGGPAAPPQSADELKTVLAKIDDVSITLGELQERINRQSPYVRQRYTSLEQKKEFLDSLVRFEILAKEAYRRGLDRDPEVIRTMKQVMIQKLMRQEFDAKITADSVPEADLRAYYDANLAEYVKAEEVRASAIIVKNRAQAERVAQEARGEAGKTNKGFRDLVMRYSADEDGKLRGGDLRYFDAAAKEPPAPVVKAAFALVNVGDVSGAIDAGNGSFYVLKQTGRRRAITKAYEDAKPQIRNKLFRDRRMTAQKEFLDASRARAKIEVNEANLAKVRVDTSNAPGDEGRDPVPPLPGAATPEAPAAPAPAAPAPAAPAPPPAPRAPGNP
jgi:peptidyl-prolyl cis-trans isomerase C